MRDQNQERPQPGLPWEGCKKQKSIMAHFWWVHLRKKRFFHNIGKYISMNQKIFVDQTLQKKLHLKIKTLKYNIIRFFCKEK